MAKPVVFILSNMREFGGAERSIATLLPTLAQQARLRIYVANEHHRRDLEALALPDADLVRVSDSNKPWAMLHSIFVLLRDYLRFRPAALLANGHKGGLLLAILRRVLLGRKFPALICVRDFDYYTLRFIMRSLPDALYVAPTPTIFAFQGYQDWGLGKHRCEVIPNAVIPPSAASPEAPAEPFFACCARITPWKGIDVLLRAMELVMKQHPTARLRIYGEVIDDEYYATLLQLRTELGLDNNVSFEPFTRDIGRVYATGAFFVIPSLSIMPGPESFCRIIIEAWSYAKPVIAFAIGGPATLIHDGEDGYLVPERDLEALADRIGHFLAEPALAARLGQAGAARVQTEFTPAVIAARFADRLLHPCKSSS